MFGRRARLAHAHDVFIHFVPAGVAGVPNTDPVTVTLIKRGKKH